MGQQIDGRPWFAMLAAVAGNADTGGRALMELVGKNASDGALYSAVDAMNELARYKTPFSFDGQLALLCDEEWNPGDVGHIFYRATQEQLFLDKVAAERSKMHPGNKLPSPAELVFDEGVSVAWREWFEVAKKRLPPMPGELYQPFYEAMLLRLRLDLCMKVYTSIVQMKQLAAKAGEGAYLTRKQLPYGDLVDLMATMGRGFLEFVEDRAVALLNDEDKQE